MPTTRLESAHRLLALEIYFRARDMGVEREIAPIGCATQWGRGGGPRQPDSSYIPFGKGLKGWPSIVILVGFKGLSLIHI